MLPSIGMLLLGGTEDTLFFLSLIPVGDQAVLVSQILSARPATAVAHLSYFILL